MARSVRTTVRGRATSCGGGGWYLACACVWVGCMEIERVQKGVEGEVEKTQTI